MDSSKNNNVKVEQQTTDNKLETKSAMVEMIVSDIKNIDSIQNWISTFSINNHLPITNINIDPKNEKVSFEVKNCKIDLNSEDFGSQIKGYAAETNPPFELKKGRIQIYRIQYEPMWSWD